MALFHKMYDVFFFMSFRKLIADYLHTSKQSYPQAQSVAAFVLVKAKCLNFKDSLEMLATMSRGTLLSEIQQKSPIKNP